MQRTKSFLALLLLLTNQTPDETPALFCRISPLFSTFGKNEMNEYEALLGIAFYLAIVLSLASLVALKKKKGILRFVPWAAILTGIIYIISAEIYYSQKEISVTVPIRVDLLFLPPFLLIPLVVGIINLGNQKTEPGSGGNG